MGAPARPIQGREEQSLQGPDPGPTASPPPGCTCPRRGHVAVLMVCLPGPAALSPGPASSQPFTALAPDLLKWDMSKHARSLHSAVAQAETSDRPYFLALPPPRPGASSRAPSPATQASHTQNPQVSALLLPRGGSSILQSTDHTPSLAPHRSSGSLPPARPLLPSPLHPQPHVPSPWPGGSPLSSGHGPVCFRSTPGPLHSMFPSAWEALPPDVHGLHKAALAIRRNPSFQIKTPMEDFPGSSG